MQDELLALVAQLVFQDHHGHWYIAINETEQLDEIIPDHIKRALLSRVAAGRADT